MRVMSAGDGYRYLLQSVAAGDGHRSLTTPLLATIALARMARRESGSRVAGRRDALLRRVG